MLNFISKKLSLFFLILIGTIFIVNSNVYAGTLSCSTTTAAGCSGTIVYRMSATKDAHAALYGQTGSPYENNVVCCIGVTGLSNSCSSGTYATVLKLTAARNAHVQQTGTYTNSACLSVPSGDSVSIGYQVSNCRGYDTILGSMSNTTNAQVGDSNAYITKICGTAKNTPIISITINDGIISYGTLAAGNSKSTINLSDTQTLTNTSNVVADINIKGFNTSCPWTLASTTGNNQYVHNFCKATDVSCSSPPTNYTALSTSYKTLYNNVAVNGTRNLDLQIIAPTESSCYNSQSASITIQATEHSWTCGETVTFPYNGSTVTYGTILLSTGQCWMDRNLGASQVATAYNDSAAYGDLFQWGRLDDGHQLRTSGTTFTQSTTDNPGHNKLILGTNYDYDWRSPQNDNLWQGEGGINNPCPSGWRVPTSTEWVSEIIAGNWKNYNDTYSSPLKLTAGGARNMMGDGLIENVGNYGEYWSSTIIENYNDSDNFSRDISFYNNGIYPNSMWSKPSGFSVRCIKDTL
jgi:uncharacterized protein (TIGR02145 family)